MAAEENLKAQAWTYFDRIVELASADGYTDPWRRDDAEADPVFEPDFDTLRQLLGVPLLLGATSQSGVLALALDVWVAYELRRAHFNPDAVWPRQSTPRVMPSTLAGLLRGATKKQRLTLEEMLRPGRGTYSGEVVANAKILGKNYVKQVDVVMSAWQTGPELMISTKRMDSSFGNNAANRVEESYGDAKNLRSRHPQASLGFMYGLSAVAFAKHANTAHRIVDLLIKLGREDDAYDAVCLIVPESPSETADEPAELTVADAEDDGGPGDVEVLPLELPSDEVDQGLRELPSVVLRSDLVPHLLSPQRFFTIMIARVLDNCPIDFHIEARRRRAASSDLV
jgi:hypothetical protein